MQGNIFSGLNLSQQDKILLHLINHGKTNIKECQKIYGIKYPSNYIDNLRKKGINIKKIKRNGIDGNGKNIYWVDYVLAPCQFQSARVNQMITDYRNGLINEKVS